MSDHELDLLEVFLSERVYSQHTEIDKRWYLRRFIAWLDRAGLKHERLSIKQVKDWIALNKWRNSMAYQQATNIRLFSVWRFGENHPLARLRLRLEDPGLQRTLTEAEVKTLWDYLDKPIENNRSNAARIRNKAILSLALDTGLRASELCRLDLKHLFLESRMLQVLAKGSKWRKCVFSEVTAERLREWLSIRGALARCETVFIGFKNNDLGKPLTRHGLLLAMHNLGEVNGMYLTVHSLRRTFATLAIRKGASTRLVQVQGGWSDIKLVERYTQALTPDDFVGFFPTTS
jgi:site-specific recombinase XerD